jgi:FtsH-binding integral membrane protein
MQIFNQKNGLPLCNNVYSGKKRGFVTKTLTVLCIQLFITAFVIYMCYNTASFYKLPIYKLYITVWCMLAMSFISMIACFITINFNRHMLYSYVFYTLFTISMSIIFAIAALQYNSKIIIQSTCTTSLITLLCISYMAITKNNSHTLHGSLYCALMVMCVLDFPTIETRLL